MAERITQVKLPNGSIYDLLDIGTTANSAAAGNHDHDGKYVKRASETTGTGSTYVPIYVGSDGVAKIIEGIDIPKSITTASGLKSLRTGYSDQDYTPFIYFGRVADATEKGANGAFSSIYGLAPFYNSSTNTVGNTGNYIRFTQYGYTTSTEGGKTLITPTSFQERYELPNVNPDITETKTYKILTTKDCYTDNQKAAFRTAIGAAASNESGSFVPMAGTTTSAPITGNVVMASAKGFYVLDANDNNTSKILIRNTGNNLHIGNNDSNTKPWISNDSAETRIFGGWDQTNNKGGALRWYEAIKDSDGNIKYAGRYILHGANYTSYAVPATGYGTDTYKIQAKTTNYTSDLITVYDHSQYGQDVVMQAGGGMYIGGGESADALRTALGDTTQEEGMYLSADGGIFLNTNCNTIANRKTIEFNTSNQMIFHNSGSKGILFIDSSSAKVPFVYYNATNIWLGATSSSAEPFTGSMNISTGWNTSNDAGNASIIVSVPKKTVASDGTVTWGSSSYTALHTGNYSTHLDGRYVLKSGDSVTGHLHVTNDGKTTYNDGKRGVSLLTSGAIVGTVTSDDTGWTLGMPGETGYTTGIRMEVNKIGTTTVAGVGRLIVGNTLLPGTLGNAGGKLCIYGSTNTTYYSGGVAKKSSWNVQNYNGNLEWYTYNGGSASSDAPIVYVTFSKNGSIIPGTGTGNSASSLGTESNKWNGAWLRNALRIQYNSYPGGIIAYNDESKKRYEIYSSSSTGAVGNLVLRVFKDDESTQSYYNYQFEHDRPALYSNTKSFSISTKDSGDNKFDLINYNGSNVWIGAISSTDTHHIGQTFISSGYNATKAEGNATIYVSVPTLTGTTWSHTSYGVLHTGNYSTYCAAASHNHDGTYLKLTGGTVTGNVVHTAYGKTGGADPKAGIVMGTNGTAFVAVADGKDRGIFIRSKKETAEVEGTNNFSNIGGIFTTTATGTAGTTGVVRIQAGNSLTNEWNVKGVLYLYDSTAYNHIIAGNDDTSAERTHHLTNSSGWLVSAAKAGVGSSSLPVYISSAGNATAISSLNLSGSVTTAGVFYCKRTGYGDTDYTPGYYFSRVKDSTNGGADGNFGYIFYRTPYVKVDGTAQNVDNSFMTFRQYGYTQSGKNVTTDTTIYDDYRLPSINASTTGKNTYYILTSKTAVTVAQGGTGATTAAAARTNLGITPANIGAATSGHNHDDTYFKISGGTITGTSKINGSFAVTSSTSNKGSTSDGKEGVYITTSSGINMTVTSATGYYLTYSPTGTTSNFQTASMRLGTLGTASAVGDACVVLGNGTAEGTIGNCSGHITIYDHTTYYHRIDVHGASTANRTHYLTNSNGWMVTSTKDTAVGGATAGPVYISSGGVATVVTSVPVNKGGTGATTASGARTNIGITSGTAAPSGGADGDIYFRY